MNLTSRIAAAITGLAELTASAVGLLGYQSVDAIVVTTIYNRFVRWAERGVWERLFRALAERGRSTDVQMIDSTHVKAHRSAGGGKGGRSARRLAARAAGATRRSTHSQMLRAAFFASS
jgi:hypothetical protein